MRYNIVRYFQLDSSLKKVIRRNVTLEEAQAHCNDPETKSQTAKSTYHVRYTKTWGPWFDGYERIEK